MPLFVLLLVGTVGGAFVDIHVLLCLAFEDASAKGLWSWQVGAQASVLAAVVASAMTWVVAAASPLPRIAVGMPTGVEGFGVAVESETLMHRNHGAWPTALLGLMGRYVLVGLL